MANTSWSPTTYKALWLLLHTLSHLIFPNAHMRWISVNASYSGGHRAPESLDNLSGWAGTELVCKLGLS